MKHQFLAYGGADVSWLALRFVVKVLFIKPTLTKVRATASIRS